MNNQACRIGSLYGKIKSEASVAELVLWWVTRLLVAAFCFIDAERIGFYLTVLFLSFICEIIRLVFPKAGISLRLQSFICVLALLSTVVGIGLGTIKKYPEYDIVLQFAGGIFAGAMGYYISLALKKPVSRNDCYFTTFFSFCFAGTVTIFRKLTEFFSDFFLGTNLCHVERVEDSHWLYRAIGMMMSPEGQRYLLDTDEDFVFSILGGIISALVVFLRLRHSKKALFVSSGKKLSDLFAHPIKRAGEKFSLEIKKVNEDTSIFDRLFWWGVRLSMLYAFFAWENRAEATLMLANLVGTFALTLIHFIFPRDSFLCKINYKVQTLITIIVFLGSYGGNYCAVYYIVPRFDLFLHFVSGVLCILGGYYVALTLVKPVSRKDSLLITLFALSFSCMIMPAWEVSEFVGDFIWGTSNQGFYWGPTEESFFFAVFGHGVGNTKLYYLYDTVYDVLLAMVTTLASVPLVWLLAQRRRVKEEIIEKEKIAC